MGLCPPTPPKYFYRGNVVLRINAVQDEEPMTAKGNGLLSPTILDHPSVLIVHIASNNSKNRSD